MRFLVLGAAGMAGHLISLYLRERGHDVTGFARHDLPFLEFQVEGDVTDMTKLRSVVRDGYDVVVNCVGVLNKAAETNPNAAWLNGELPHVLADMTADLSARVFHMSTDCVFAGNTGPYTEASNPDGVSAYDRTKAAGELDDGKNLTFRNSIVGPDMNPNGIGLLNWFMQQPGPIKGFTGAIWTGLTTLELAKAMEHEAAEDAHGLVNMVPEGSINKCELLELFNDELRGGRIEIIPDAGLQLDKTLMRTNFGPTYRPKSYPEQIREMAGWVRAHKELYPHYEVI
ncbi:sugar nucleotide-binding protein [uncultured Senegalimassilia sp.]|uniref:SDR family oxidoreductase n=1 Tax=uncultured Senegalimassilia sp. TaxID=1714350 RepID=UPI0025E66424|nr:sugar nucleotide-binding protein [uncultured Senegalimassilia sp.]